MVIKNVSLLHSEFVSTGLVEYGFSYHTVFGRFLSFVLRPKTVLEFGCGYGQQSDYLARFIPGGSDVTCIEPGIDENNHKNLLPLQFNSEKQCLKKYFKDDSSLIGTLNITL